MLNNSIIHKHAKKTTSKIKRLPRSEFELDFLRVTAHISEASLQLVSSRVVKGVGFSVWRHGFNTNR